MKQSGDEKLEVLLELAQNYDRKYRQLAAMGRQTPLPKLLPGLLQQAELLTDRVRALQQQLAPVMAANPEGAVDLGTAIKTLCESFDEILILFHVLVEQSAGRQSA